MRFLVLGAGAVGSVFGGFLAKAGNDVTIIGREQHIEAIKKNSLCIGGIWGEHRIGNLRAYTSLRELFAEGIGFFDVALITVKSYDTGKILKELMTCCSEMPPVVSLQNGIGNVELIASHVGIDKTIGGRVIFGVEFIKPGCVKVTVCADKTVIGGMGLLKGGSFVEKLAQKFSQAAIPTVTTDNIESYIWGKVLYNCALNALATLVNVHYGQLLSFEGTRSIMKEIISEIFAVARARNIPLEWENANEYISALFDKLIPLTFDHHPSMLQDIQRGKRTEIDALNGAIVRLGDEAGIPCPYNWTVTKLIKAKEST